MTPCHFDGLLSFKFLAMSGAPNTNNTAKFFFVRPAISLVSDITISGGTGTSEDPYVVE